MLIGAFKNGPHVTRFRADRELIDGSSTTFSSSQDARSWFLHVLGRVALRGAGVVRMSLSSHLRPATLPLSSHHLLVDIPVNYNSVFQYGGSRRDHSRWVSPSKFHNFVFPTCVRHVVENQEAMEQGTQSGMSPAPVSG